MMYISRLKEFLLKVRAEKGTKENILFLLIPIVSYLLLSGLLSEKISEHNMFDNYAVNADSYSYLQVGNWLLGGAETEHLAYRPFLFPLIIALLNNIGGPALIWLFHFCCYILSAFILFLSFKLYFEKRIYYLTFGIFFLLNFSLIGITYHALTETVVVLGTSLLIYFSVLILKEKINLSQYLIRVISLIGILTLIKPIFSIPFFLGLIFIGILILLKKVNFRIIIHPIVLLTFLGITAQFMIMHSNYNEFTISKVGSKTYKRYLIKQVIMTQKNIDAEEALVVVESMSSDEIASYSFNNKGIILTHLLQNIKQNIGDSYIENYINPDINRQPAIFMKLYNKVLFYFIFIIFLFSIALLYYQFRKRQFKNGLVIAFLLTLFFYFIVVNGISFHQRDRLVLGILPLWIFLITFSIHQTHKLISRLISK